MRTETENAPQERAAVIVVEEETEGDGREFLAALLSHDAVDDAVTELLFEHVVEGRYHPSVVAASLPPLIEEILGTTRSEDWRVLAEALIIEGPSAVGARAVKKSGAGERRVSEQGTRLDVGLIREFLWLALTHPFNAARLGGLRADLASRAAVHPAVIAQSLPGVMAGALRAAAGEGGWNVITGQLIAEVRVVDGEAADGRPA